MSIKIFHVADLHIGMKFNSYPTYVSEVLQKARIESLEKLIETANLQQCDLFVIAGDLFNGISGIDKKTISKVMSALEGFAGKCVAVLPGNHDYDNGMIDLWTDFKKKNDKIVLLNESYPYSLEKYGLNTMLYPAPCQTKHSSENNISWIKDYKVDDEFINIGIAHGSLAGLSPDLKNEYYTMTESELLKIPVDAWLLGHTHITYPNKQTISDNKIFNPGTPEPDGLDCLHSGSAWLISVSDEKKVKGELITTGLYRFIDQVFNIESKNDLIKLENDIIQTNADKTIARISLDGRVTEDLYQEAVEILDRIEKSILYLRRDVSAFGIKITKEKIHKEFSEGSFPQLLLMELTDDENALQLAYEFIMGVKK